MANAHRTNVLVTSCLKTPVDPHTKAPLASYERERVLPYTATSHMDNRDYEKELEYEDSGSDFCDEDYMAKGGPLLMTDYRAAGDRLDLSEIFFSNEEYYSKLEELKRAHLRTMAELESMYRRKLQLKAMEPLDVTMLETGRHRLPWLNSSPAASRRLRKSHSAVELRRGSRQSDSSDEDEAASNDVEKGLLFSPKEHIKNMWQDFKLSPYNRHLTSSSMHSLPADQKRQRKGKGKKRQGHKVGEQEHWKHRMTVPKPFQMTVREAERRKRGIKTRSEIEKENAELRRQLEELTECQKKFRASPVPAHVHLPLYEELQERTEERRRMREREDQHLRSIQKPFSFLERERLKKEQKQLLSPQPSDREKFKPFKAKPVPKAVYAAASGEQMKEEQLYRSIKIQMRAQEMLSSASMPPSMLARRLSDRKKTKDGSASEDENFSHKPQINKEVPDFDASYRRFQKHLEKHKEVKPTTACEPFELRTSHITSHRERILADIEKEQTSPRITRWPYISPGPTRTANSSLCSSLSGSLELLPTKVTDATRKRHEAVRKVLEQRKKAEEEEEQWKERQKQREKKLQKVVLKRAQANDPHMALSQTHPSKLKEFRKQELQRRREYQQEVKEMQRRVKGRPLLLEQVAQRNAKQAAEKRYTDALHGCDLTEEFISSKVAKSGSARKASPSSDSRQSDQDEPDMGYKPVHYRKVFLDDEDVDVDTRDGGSDATSLNHRDGEEASSHHSDQDYRRNDDDDDAHSDESYHYSDDHENYSDDSEHDADTTQQEAGE
ncbi:protein FAM161A [Epinephelus lanceolatus]|uniref:protein FAM161A-like n=1 Tax=Epinephelus lanceolatus TaxID=310571 RepID=UPI00144863D2|nr:protein FAM161A-like [Epinephelus lanceolatus]XP_033479563.1 protein FAM161A-like [Epinephelus lanceolatus]